MRSPRFLPCLTGLIPVLCHSFVLIPGAIAQPFISLDRTPPSPTQSVSSALLLAQSPHVLLEQQGTLADGDTILTVDNSLFDEYAFDGFAGQRVSIVLESAEFDTYLIVLDPWGNAIAENDDMSPSNFNSSLTITLPEDGTYTVVVNSYDQTGRGPYSLTVTAINLPTSLPQPDLGMSPDCNAVLLAAENRLEQNRNLAVTLELIDVSQTYRDYPTDRINGFAFVMRGPSANDVMTSPDFMRSVSTEVIQQCDTIGLVEFWVAESDWGLTYGLIEENRIDEFSCIRQEEYREPEWGYMICS